MDAAVLPFAKFTRLPSELRSHIISYNSYSTLAKYAQCSILCNADIQRYNTRPPRHIAFTHDEKSATINLIYNRQNGSMFNYTLHFKKSNSTLWRRLKRFFSVIKVSDKAPYQAAIKYVKNRFEYVKTGECALLEFRGKLYLPELSTIIEVQNIEWKVVFNESMYPKFFDSVKNAKNERLKLRLVSEPRNVYNIPVEFFRTEFFRNLARFECSLLLPGLQDREFLAMKAPEISINSSAISDRVIHQKIQQWSTNPTNQPVDYRFFRSNGHFDKSVVLENLQIIDTKQFITKIQHPNGTYALFHDSANVMRFRTIQTYIF